MDDRELDLLLEQLDEALGDGVVDPEDALEIAILAGLAARAGAPEDALASARRVLAERRDLVEAAWRELDLEALQEAVDALLGGEQVDEEEIEEAILDVDEVIAASIWVGETERVAALAREVDRTVGLAPELFAGLVREARRLARHPDVARWPELYGFWLRIAGAPDRG